MTDVADLAAELVAIPSPSGQEEAALSACAAAMEARGFDVSRDAAGNVLGVVGEGSPRLLLDGHADTVAPNPGWTRDPYRPERRDGRLYGLGAVDMKGAIAAMIAGVGDAAAAGEVAGTVGVSVSTLEEVLEGAALAPVVDAFRPDGVVIAEPSGCALALAQRGRAELTVELTGRAAHAAFPERGRSALTAAARLLLALEERRPPEHPELGPGILVATEARTEPFPGISIVPSRCRLRLDRRTLPGETAEDVLGELREALEGLEDGVRGEVALSDGALQTWTGAEVGGPRFLPAWQAPPESGLARAAAAALGAAPRTHWPFCTNGSLTAGRGIPTIGFGPGDPGLAHQADEHVPIADLERARAGYAALAGMTWRQG